MARHNVLSKTDRALVAYLTANLVGVEVGIYPAKRSEDREVPYVVVFSERAKQDPPGSGHWDLEVAVMIKTAAAPTQDVSETAQDIKDQSEEIEGAIIDLFLSGAHPGQQDTELEDDITSAAQASGAAGDSDLSDFVVTDCSLKDQEAGFDAKGNNWVTTLNLEVTATMGIL